VNVLVAVAGVAAGGNPGVAGAGAAMSGIKSIIDLLPFWRQARTPLKQRIQTLLDEALIRHHLSEGHKALIPQMLDKAHPADKDVIRCAWSPEQIARLMADACKGGDPAHAHPLAQDSFVRVVTDILQHVLLDPQFRADIQPLHDQALAQSMAALGMGMDGIAKRQLDQHGEVMGALSAEAQTMQLMQETLEKMLGLVEDLAQPTRYLPGLAAQGNTLSFLPSDADEIGKAIAAGDRERALILSRELTARLMARRTEAREEARHKDSEASDAIARSLATEADLMWKGGSSRRRILERLVLARDEAASPDLRSEIEDRLQRRFNLALHRRGDLGAALDLFGDMVAKGLQPNEITYNVLIAKAPSIKRALEIRNEMLEKGLEPNEFTYNTLIAKAPSFQRAQELHDEMVAMGKEPDEITYNTLISKAPDFQRAEALRDEMEAMGKEPDEITFNTLIAKAPDFQRALQLQKEMVQKSKEPDTVTYNTLISKAPCFKESLALHDEMVQKGKEPDSFTYAILMKKATVLKEAEPLLSEMIARRLKPNSYHFNLLLGLAVGELEAMRIYRRMAALVPERKVYEVTTLIRSSKNVTDAYKIALDFRKAGGRLDARMIGAIMAKTRDLDKLEKFLNQMLEKGPEPDAFCFQYVIQSTEDRAKKLSWLRRMVGRGLEPDERHWQHLSANGITRDDL